MHRYLAAGLRIESELALPGLVAAEAPDAVDLSIRLGDVPSEVDGALEAGPNWQRAERTIRLSIPGVADFLVRDCEVFAQPLNGAAPEDLAIFLAGPMLGMALHLRGATPLMASAVRVGDRAVLFCGESGVGKSTTAAALGQRGYPLIADDLVGLDLSGATPPRALPDGSTLKLWAQATRRLDLEAGAPVRAALMKHHVEPPAGLAGPAPIAAIYVLREARASQAPGIERPNITDTTILVRRCSYRPNLVRALDQKGAYFMAAARIANAGGVFLWHRAPGFDRLPSQLDALEAHWAEIGLKPGKAA